MSETCGCPNGLGYRFHRYPCRRAGEIERLTADQTTALPDERNDHE